MTVEIRENSDSSITIKHLTYAQLQVFNNIFGEPMASGNKPVNPENQQYKIKPITINGADYSYSVFDAPNNDENAYTISLQKLRN